MTQNFDIKITIDENLDNKIKQIAIQIRPKWINLLTNLRIDCLRAGITNSLYACYLQSAGLNDHETILFRIYNEKSEKLINRKNEIEAMCLTHKQKLGPEYYGKFNNGIFYEFLPGSILDLEMLSSEFVYSEISKAMAQLHFVDFKGYSNDFISNSEIFIFNQIWKLYDLVQDDYKANMTKMTDDLFCLIPSKSKLKYEIDLYQNHMIDFTSKNKSLIVFSHNDLFFGNIIYNKTTEYPIKFIDYEYSGRNYQAYDIANHFNEFSGVESPNYSYFPNKDLQLRWLVIYLSEFFHLVNKFYGHNKEKHMVLSEEILNKFYEEVNKFTLASHLIWGLWGLVQAQVSDYDYDFVSYSVIRFKEYFKRKSEVGI